NEEEARTRRKKVQKEVDFYGAMDGASKFVQGDVRAGLIITAINLIGGIIIGMAIRKESFGFAVETYGKLTIGDGLVSQIPGLLATTATGMIVTRAASEKELSQEFKSQIFSNPKTLYVVSACLALAAFIPGLPMFSLFFFSIGLAYLAYIIDRNAKETITSIEKKEAENKAEKKPDYYKELRTDPIEVELGLNLVPLVNASLGGVLLDQITNLRRRFATDTGLVIPAVRILDNLELDPDSYAIKIHGVIVGDSKIRPTKLMAIDNSGKRALDQIMGEEFLEPTFGFKAKWIDPADKVDAENKGAAVVDPSTVIVTHLKELISNHAASLLGREEVKNLLDHVKTSYPTLVSEIDEKKLGVGLIQQVLQNLLREGLGIKNLASILEAILNNEPKTRDPFFLSESVRQAISRQIVTDYLSKDGKLHVVTMDPKVSEKLSKSIVVDPIEG
ncbi:MAG TPA: flagellar biosynthesis protein FlhA, partial [Leptospiraceae bacterium]|nr:flagellar biosynthesis protein FlhA [Leptospiraceae bacterium]